MTCVDSLACLFDFGEEASRGEAVEDHICTGVGREGRGGGFIHLFGDGPAAGSGCGGGRGVFFLTFLWFGRLDAYVARFSVGMAPPPGVVTGVLHSLRLIRRIGSKKTKNSKVFIHCRALESPRLVHRKQVSG